MRGRLALFRREESLVYPRLPLQLSGGRDFQLHGVMNTFRKKHTHSAASPGAVEAGTLPGMPPAALELSGVVERVIFHNAENGYTVLNIKTATGDTQTAVGQMLDPQAGMSLKLTGKYANNPKFGRQFAWSMFEAILPATAEGIRHYLGSGLIKGLGPKMAARIVDHFGDETLNVLDTQPEALLRVAGIGEKTLERLKEGWGEQQGIRDLIMFLQPNGVSTSYAVRIYRHYGRHALAIVQENPYRLAMDIRGIGFVTADGVAQKLGFSSESPLRAEAGLLYMLQRLNDEGHVYYPKDALVNLTSSELGIQHHLLEEALDSLRLEQRVVIEDMEGGQGVYLARFHVYESKIAFYLQRLLKSPKTVRFSDPEAIINKVLEDLDIALAPEQLAALREATRAKVMVLTGGPGTGKTTIVQAIIRAFSAANARILLAAPTGRAAKRLSETTGREARTLHRLLEYSPGEDGFLRNEDNPLACGLLVVDEASMMDTMLMYHLLKAVPLGATLLLVGDVNQLPSVGPGNVLKDVIRASVLPVVELIEVFRQAAESDIIVNAHRINRGEDLLPPVGKDRLSDFYFIRQEDPQLAAEAVVQLVRDHIPRRFRLNPVEDIQVLTPMHKGAAGAANLNTLLQKALNPRPVAVRRGEREYRLNDKVMQIRNNYDKDVFNGDIGYIYAADTENRELGISFDDRKVIYQFEELDEIVPAYAVTVHKSQGSEYPAVVVVLLAQHYMLLQRNLLYTGVTRGRNLVILVGEPRALRMAIKNNRMQRRHTWLAQRLRRGLPLLGDDPPPLVEEIGPVQPENDEDEGRWAQPPSDDDYSGEYF